MKRNLIYNSVYMFRYKVKLESFFFFKNECNFNLQGSSWALTVSNFSLQENWGEVTVSSGDFIGQNYNIFCQFRR